VIKRVKALHQRYRSVCQFINVYIAEAHALDEWPVGNGYDGRKAFYQHKTLEQRISVAKEFIEDYKYEIPMVVDTMENNFDKVFASWPVRFYLLYKGKIFYKAMPKKDQYTYDFDELTDCLLGLLTKLADGKPLPGPPAESCDDDEECETGSCCATGACNMPLLDKPPATAAAPAPAGAPPPAAAAVAVAAKVGASAA